MGCFFSCNSSQPFDCVRVIHVNGYVEDFRAPITVAHVTGKPPKHVLCSSAHLLYSGAQQFRPDDLLEPGRLYFLLPHSVFQSDSSPVDLASLLTRLTAIAKRGGPAAPCRVGSVSEREQTDRFGFQLEPKGRMWSRARTWKPDLDTILERSFGRSMRHSSSGSTREALLLHEE